MKGIIRLILQLPKWYGISIVFIYGILLAELLSTIINFISIESSWVNIFKIIVNINYGVTIFSGIIVWLITALLFHLTALLFNGQASFARIAIATSYPHLIPAIMILIGIIILDSIQIPQTNDIAAILINHPQFKIAMNLVNYSFIPYYLIVAIFIHHIYQIKYLNAILSVALPVAGIWLVTELVKLI